MYILLVIIIIKNSTLTMKPLEFFLFFKKEIRLSSILHAGFLLLLITLFCLLLY